MLTAQNYYQRKKYNLIKITKFTVKIMINNKDPPELLQCFGFFEAS